MKVKTSRIPGFYQKTCDERIALLQNYTDVNAHSIALLRETQSLSIQTANQMIENLVALMPLPLGVATNFIINGNELLIPMVTEEPSVVAASCNAARLARSTGGFFAESDPSMMVGQILLTNVPDFNALIISLESQHVELLAGLNQSDPMLIRHGGGARDIQARHVTTERGPMIVVDLFVDVKDAMGANIVNSMAELLAPLLEQISGGTCRMKIVSNFATKRLVRARATWSHHELGEATIENILDAYAFARADVFRATTHNKGVMNGIDALALATGNDFRALEAGVHAWAARSGVYQPVTHFSKNEQGDLEGFIEIPLAVGTVGGAISHHPIAQCSLNILGVTTSQELACIMASVGLAQNFAALRALVTDGIQKGHMKLHRRKEACEEESNR